MLSERDEVRRLLWWTASELGTSSILDVLGPELRVDPGPAITYPRGAAVAAPVSLITTEPHDGVSERERPILSVRRARLDGAILLIASNGADLAVFGSNMVLEAACGGALGVATDGAFRDDAIVSRLPLFVAGNRRTPLSRDGYHSYPVESASVFGIRWETGDWLLHDGDGLVRIPRARLDEVVEELSAHNAGARAVFAL